MAKKKPTIRSNTKPKTTPEPPAVVPEDFYNEYNDLRNALRFDKDGIDDALIMQPVLFEQVSSHLARAINRRDLVREQQKQVEAQVSSRVREDAEAKLTVKEVEAAVEQDAEYINAREVYKQASYWVDMWDGLKDSYRQRSAALRDLTQLHVTGHYQVGGRSYEDVRKEMAEQRRQ